MPTDEICYSCTLDIIKAIKEPESTKENIKKLVFKLSKEEGIDSCTKHYIDAARESLKTWCHG